MDMLMVLSLIMPRLILQMSLQSDDICCVFMHTLEITVLRVEPVTSPDRGIAVLFTAVR